MWSLNRSHAQTPYVVVEPPGSPGNEEEATVTSEVAQRVGWRSKIALKDRVMSGLTFPFSSRTTAVFGPAAVGGRCCQAERRLTVEDRGAAYQAEFAAAGISRPK
jgi:hypothetical protein